ncbi:hypothetical protein QAD02_019970, partial [Eretmocerus hayati]
GGEFSQTVGRARVSELRAMGSTVALGPLLLLLLIVVAAVLVVASPGPKRPPLGGDGPYKVHRRRSIQNAALTRRIAKRTGGEACHPYKPFKCPEDNTCISIQYLCDGAPDCREGYDEDPRLCTAAKRPPVEETASFLQALLASHGPNYLEKLFGNKARDALAPLGGVNKVAIALSESQTIEDFGAALHLMRSDLEHLRSVFIAVENGDLGLLKSLGIKDSELGDVKFFLEKLVDTGFLD